MSREAVIGIMNEFRWDVEDICNALIETRNGFDALQTADDEKADKIKDLENQVDELQTRIDNLESRLADYRSRRHESS